MNKLRKDETDSLTALFPKHDIPRPRHFIPKFIQLKKKKANTKCCKILTESRLLITKTDPMLCSNPSSPNYLFFYTLILKSS